MVSRAAATLLACGLGAVSGVAVSHQPTMEAAALAAAQSELQEQKALVRREAITDPAALSEAGLGDPSSTDAVNRIMNLDVTGSTKEGEVNTGDKLFWLEAGCRSLTPDPLLAGKFAAVSEQVGSVQCCKIESDNNGTLCTRTASGVCLSNETAEELVSFSQAAIACETNGYRLCTKQELQEDTASGCCKTGCGIDSKLVWTSTFSYKGLKQSNEQLETDIQNVKSENLKIEQEHRDLASRLGDLQAELNNTKIADGYKPPPPRETIDKAPIHTITGEEAEALAKENNRLWYEVQAMRRENDELKDHIVAIVNGSIVEGPPSRGGPGGHGGRGGRDGPGRGPRGSGGSGAFDRDGKPYGAGQTWPGSSQGNLSGFVDVPRVRNLDTVMMKTEEEESKSKATTTLAVEVTVGSQIIHNSASSVGALVPFFVSALVGLARM